MSERAWTSSASTTYFFGKITGKLAGCHVIGTAGSDDKCKFLVDVLGCDRAINYKKESVFKVLKSEYPKGVDVVYECIGGEMFDACVNNLAVKGRLVVIGR